MSDQMDGKAILQLYFGCEVSDIHEFVILMPLPPRNLDDFKKLCDEVQTEFTGWVGSGFVGWAGRCYVTAICPGTGSSQIGDGTLAVGHGPCKVAIFVGSIGGLVDNISIGDIVVVDEAVVGEGFSRYHLGKTPADDTFGQIVRADDALMDYLWPRVRGMARRLGVTAHKGRAFTTESLLAETESFLQGIVRLGCIGIEKEASAFYTAARKAEIQAAAVLCVSDLPLHQKSLFAERTQEEEEKRVRVRHEMIPQIILELAAGLALLP
jgi:purine-nucleoside phosphorylase